MATRIFPNEPYALINLGKRQQSAGQLDLAKLTWEKVLKQDPKNKSVKELLDQLEPEHQ